jgi:DNA-binding MarR family transcriptional regulator
MDRSYQQLDPIIHQPARLSMMAALASAKEVEFSTLRDAIKISDSLLSRYASNLEEVGYIKIHKTFVGKRPKTWLSITKDGRQAFDNHVNLLKHIVNQDISKKHQK